MELTPLPQIPLLDLRGKRQSKESGETRKEGKEGRERKGDEGGESKGCDRIQDFKHRYVVSYPAGAQKSTLPRYRVNNEARQVYSSPYSVRDFTCL